jgi:hypothetical protein
MRKISILWRDLKIVIKAVWLNLLLFAVLLAGAVALLRLSGAYPQANWLDLLVDAFHMSVIERVAQPGDGVMPAVLTFLLPLLTVIILGEGAVRVLTVFIARGEHREEWDTMVVKTYTNHIVVCGVGELGTALVKRIHVDHPEARIVLVDLRPGLLTETGLLGDNVVCVQSDMTSIETLKKVNCHKARLVLLASGNDAFNLEAAYKIQQLNPQTEIWVRLHHSGLADLMDLSRKPNLHFFSPYQQAADAIAGHLLQEEKINK